MGAYCVYPDEYSPGQPKNTPLFRLLDTHYEEFRDVYDERFSKLYEYWRPVTDELLREMLPEQRKIHFPIARRCPRFLKKYP